MLALGPWGSLLITCLGMVKGHLCRLKVRLKRGKGDQRREMGNEKEQEAGIGDVRNIRKSERMPLLQRRDG